MIHGLNDDKTLEQNRYGGGYPVLGTLRKGAPRQPKKAGRDLQYFRFDSPKPNMQALFTEVFGDQPQHIPFFFPFEGSPEVSAVEMNFNSYMGAFNESHMVRQCDGQNLLFERDSTNRWVPVSNKPCLGQPGCGCKASGILHILIPQLLPGKDNSRGEFGVVIARTTSPVDVANLSKAIHQFNQLSQGNLTGTRYILSRVPVKMPTPGYGRKEMYMLQITLDSHYAVNRPQIEAGNMPELFLPNTTTDIDTEKERFFLNAEFVYELSRAEIKTILNTAGITGFNPTRIDEMNRILEEETF